MITCSSGVCTQHNALFLCREQRRLVCFGSRPLDRRARTQISNSDDEIKIAQINLRLQRLGRLFKSRSSQGTNSDEKRISFIDYILHDSTQNRSAIVHSCTLGILKHIRQSPTPDTQQYFYINIPKSVVKLKSPSRSRYSYRIHSPRARNVIKITLSHETVAAPWAIIDPIKLAIH